MKRLLVCIVLALVLLTGCGGRYSVTDGMADAVSVGTGGTGYLPWLLITTPVFVILEKVTTGESVVEEGEEAEHENR